MESVFIDFLFIFAVYFILTSFKDIKILALYTNSTCGVDNSPVTVVHEGIGAIETYPWMGVLYYPIGKKRFISAVVLVTKQIVIADAGEIDKLPKVDFRARTRVVLGQTCGRGEIRVRDYTFHPDYDKNTFSALAMVQLEVDHVRQELRPICPPPSHFIQPQFFAMTMSDGCKNSKIRIHKMMTVDQNQCRNFYRRSGLDIESIWPTHTACARAISGGRCLWRSGAVLAVKQDGRWRLLGFSVYGPGCGAPARFLDYGMYHSWVRRSASTIGQPAISRLGENHLVLRRSLSNVQRYGPCDAEETKAEIYTDDMRIVNPRIGLYKAKYNVTLVTNVEYSCIVFRATPIQVEDYEEMKLEVPLAIDLVQAEIPKIHLRRWCALPTAMCYGFQFIEINFFVDISFTYTLKLNVLAYGKPARILHPDTALKYVNKRTPILTIADYALVAHLLVVWENNTEHKWFYPADVGDVP